MVAPPERTERSMNIRAQIYGSSKPEEPILRDKRPKGAKGDALDSVSVSRQESRRGNSRTEDRHRLSEETITVTYEGVSHEAQLINVSGGGVMIRGALDLKLWDTVELRLGDHGTIECAVRWMRGDCVGLEFAHETRLDCSSDELAAVLRDVITRSFPDAEFDQSTEQPQDLQPADYEKSPLPERRVEEQRTAERRVRNARSKPGDHRRASRHPLIWSGTLHLDNQSTTVRVRNISSSGAMIECTQSLAVGAEPVLQLNEEAALAATVQWVVGAQVGLSFHRPFDMRLLSRSKPEVATAPTQWLRPAYLEASEEQDESDPWDPRWERLTMREINLELEGFLKR
jgi:hypothetical protein